MNAYRCDSPRCHGPCKHAIRARPSLLPYSTRELVLGLAALVFTVVFLVAAFGLVP